MKLSRLLSFSFWCRLCTKSHQKEKLKANSCTLRTSIDWHWKIYPQWS